MSQSAAFIMTFIISGGIHDLATVVVSRSFAFLFTPWFFLLTIGAALEIFDKDYAAGVDQSEAGERVSGQNPFAFAVPDTHAALERTLQFWATLMHEPVLTLWQDLNVRLRSPEGLQITLFQTQTNTDFEQTKEGKE